jgi:hypothetical protein
MLSPLAPGGVEHINKNGGTVTGAAAGALDKTSELGQWLRGTYNYTLDQGSALVRGNLAPLKHPKGTK